MKRVAIASILLILILGTVAVLYFDVFNLRFARQAAFAGIISSEDTRRVSSRFDKYLSDYDPAIRARAALAIGRIGDPKAAEHLFRLLNDSSAEVAQTAAFAIGLTGKEIFAERLLDSTTYLPPEVLASAIQSIGRLSDSMMTDIIMALTSYLSHSDPRVREQAAYALCRAGAKSSWEKLADICRRDQVRPVQAAALYALSRMGIKEATALYEEWLPDIDPSLRSMAYRGVALSKDDNKTPLVACGLNDKNNNVVSQAVTSLTSIGSPKAIKYLADQYPGESDEKLKVQYMESLTRLGSDAVSEYARNEIENDSGSINVKAAAIVYLAKIEKENCLPLIDSLAELKSIYLNANIAQALSEIGGDAVKPRLVSLFDDSTAYVRAAAFEALCTIDKPNLDFYLKKALQDKDFVIKSLAVDKVGQLKDDKYLNDLMNIIKMGKDAPVDLKRSVVSAASEFIGATAEDSLVEDIIYHGLMDPEYLVSRDASDIYINKLGADKSAYVTGPTALIGERRIKAELNRYKKNPMAIISTDHGEIEMELFFDIAPLTVYSFISLAKQGFYDNLIFHRVVPNFVIQGGDPRGDGWGGPGYFIRDEYSNLSFKRGTVGIAHSGKDSGGSQFFIMLSDQPHLDGRYTLFGRVTRGINVVDNIVRGDMIEHISIIEDKTK